MQTNARPDKQVSPMTPDTSKLLPLPTNYHHPTFGPRRSETASGDKNKGWQSMITDCLARFYACDTESYIPKICSRTCWTCTSWRRVYRNIDTTDTHSSGSLIFSSRLHQLRGSMLVMPAMVFFLSFSLLI